MSNPAFYQALLAGERSRFHNVIAAVVPDKLDWKPEPKARTAQELIGHLIGHAQDLVELIDDGIVHHRTNVPFENLADGLELFDRSYDALLGKLEDLDTATWDKPAEFYVGEHLAWTAPAQELMWGFLFDSIHHRGQLSTYLRPMGGKVPSIYGPSADDQGEPH